jgi:hypothetical protein
MACSGVDALVTALSDAAFWDTQCKIRGATNAREISMIPINCCNTTIKMYHFYYRLQFFNETGREPF